MTMPSPRPAYQKYEVAVHKSAIDGFGAYAAEDIPARRKIGEIRGESISVAEARRRAVGQARIMIVEVSARKAIDASASNDPMRWKLPKFIQMRNARPTMLRSGTKPQ